MRPIGLTFLLVIGGCASHITLREPAGVEGPSLRIMSYNVNFGGAGMDQGVAAIAEGEADVVCLQETTPQWEQELKRALAEVYPYMDFRHSPGAGGQAFLSKHPLEEIAYVSEKPGWFPGWIVKAKTPLGTVQFVNVHLRPPLSERGSATPSAYLGTGSIRREEVQVICEQIEAGTPAVILGDFNENDSGKAVTWLRRQGYNDALGRVDSSTNTWEWQTSVITLRGRYDHILYSGELWCAEARVMRRGMSDHFPVTAVITRKPRD